jgi:hypothetical protein
VDGARYGAAKNLTSLTLDSPTGLVVPHKSENDVGAGRDGLSRKIGLSEV